MSVRQYFICPVSEKRVNERTARLTALFTVLLLLSAGLSGSIIPVVFLAIDFYLRAFGFQKYSILGFISRNLVTVFKFNENLINAGPKIFAARIGFVFTIIILSAGVAGLNIAAFSAGTILTVFSFLEAVFGICVACEIYPLLYRLLYRVRFE
jgi:hypothetical protein